jgi:response regulator RpfG family c-di-GMP phosphodiesterase
MTTIKSNHAILLVDDEPSILKALQRLLRNKGYPIKTAAGGVDGLRQIRESEVPIALIISDQCMPEMSGAQFLEQAKVIVPDAMRFLLTGYSDMSAVVEAVNKGEIHRYLTKPWNDEEFVLGVGQALEHYELLGENRRLLEVTRRQNQELGELNRHLEDKVSERTIEVQKKNEDLAGLNAKLEQSFMETIRLMSSLIETLNPKLGKYMRNVADLSRLVARDFGLDAAEVDQIEMAALIHDVGLLGLADKLWERDEKELTEGEYKQFRNHPIIASVCLGSIEKLGAVSEIVRHHHENQDGSGFPYGIQGEKIPWGAQIIAAAGDYCRVVHGWKAEKSYIFNRAKACLGTAAGVVSSEAPEQMIGAVAQKLLHLNAGKKYDGRIVSAILSHVDRSKACSLDPETDAAEALEIEVKRLSEGMVLASDLRLTDGRLLLAKGARMKLSSLETVRRLNAHGLVEKHVWINKIKGE